jgi:hypothetical protein
MRNLVFSPARKKIVQHRYCKRINQNLDNHTSWGIRLEVLFRGFSPSEMFRIEAEIRDLIARYKSQAIKSGQLKEVVLENLITKPFKDEVM